MSLCDWLITVQFCTLTTFHQSTYKHVFSPFVCYCCLVHSMLYQVGCYYTQLYRRILLVVNYDERHCFRCEVQRCGS
jgi:hypothetical protein